MIIRLLFLSLSYDIRRNKKAFFKMKKALK